MDILSLVQPDQVAEIELTHPVTEEKLGIVVQVLSAQSDAVKSAQRKSVDANLLRQQKGKALKSAALEDQAIDRAASMITGWDWNSDLTLNGQSKPECTKKNCIALVTNDNFFDQINEAASDNANFTLKYVKPSAKP